MATHKKQPASRSKNTTALMKKLARIILNLIKPLDLNLTVTSMMRTQYNPDYGKLKDKGWSHQ